jgi:hypothetical protein
MVSDFVELKTADNSWDAFYMDWTRQCSDFDEDIASYAEGSFSVLKPLASSVEANAGVFASLDVAGSYMSVCQLNVAALPGSHGKTLRVRFLTLAPRFDFGQYQIEDYGQVLSDAFASVYNLSETDDKFGAQHIKFHLRSPMERAFFASVGNRLSKIPIFSKVEMQGMWLHVTKA